MRRVSKFLSLLFVCALAVLSTQAQGPRNVRVDFKETTLKNGLRVITVEDHSAPVVAISLTYNVGSRNERKGRTGFAHLFEHMMFKGSENIGSGEHFLLVFNNGGSMNGTTNEDRTNYFEVLPANQLDLALFLESDRMKSLAITKENLDNQRNAVQEERRLGVDNQAYGKSGELQQELLYDNFAYKHSVIGSMEDLNAAREAGLPVLRKDFIVDPFQIFEARAWGADAVLLIVRALGAEFPSLMRAVEALGMDALVEVFDDEDLDRALDAGATTIGINHRDLTTFEVDPERTQKLAPRIPEDHTIVAFSGVSRRAEVETLASAGAHAVLVGESVVTASDPAAKVADLAGRS